MFSSDEKEGHKPWRIQENLRNHMGSQYVKPDVQPTEQTEEHIKRDEGRCQGIGVESGFCNQADKNKTRTDNMA
jgi:hypothetical protein